MRVVRLERGNRAGVLDGEVYKKPVEAPVTPCWANVCFNEVIKVNKGISNGPLVEVTNYLSKGVLKKIACNFLVVKKIGRT